MTWSNCSNTFFRPATWTSTWNTYLALLPVTNLCATNIYLVSLPKAPHFFRAKQVLLCNHTNTLWAVTPGTVCHLQCWYETYKSGVRHFHNLCSTTTLRVVIGFTLFVCCHLSQFCTNNDRTKERNR
jgi:hypothetical protein